MYALTVSNLEKLKIHVLTAMVVVRATMRTVLVSSAMGKAPKGFSMKSKDEQIRFLGDRITILESIKDHLPFTRSEIDYLRHLVEQEKIRIIDDISSVRRRENFTDVQKEILTRTHGKNFFRTANHIKKLEMAVKTLKGIENYLYPENKKSLL